jgi:rubrerythrin
MNRCTLGGAMSTGWEWTCKWCGHVNRGTDSSLLCEKCGTPR